MTDLKNVIEDAIETAWESGVSQDCRYGQMWNGEMCISASLVHHLRNGPLKNSKEIRYWFEASFPKINSGNTGRIDLILAKPNFPVDCQSPEEWETIRDNLLEDGILAAIEVKYASPYYASDFKKLYELQKMTDYEILLVFACVAYSTSKGDVSTQREERIKMASKYNVKLLFGNPHNTSSWPP